MLAFYENRKTDFSAKDCSHGNRHLGCSAHLHYHIEMAIMLEGKTVAYADTERCVLSDGDIFISFPNQIHRYESSGDERFFLFIINPNLMPELTAVFTENLPRQNLIKGLGNDPDYVICSRSCSCKRTKMTDTARPSDRAFCWRSFLACLCTWILPNPPQVMRIR